MLIFAASPDPANCKLAEPYFFSAVFSCAFPNALIVFPFCSAGKINPVDFPLMKILSLSTAAIVPDATSDPPTS